MAEMAREEVRRGPGRHGAPATPSCKPPAAARPRRRAQRVPRDPRRHGGDESALFAGDLARMYLRYAERQGWRTELMSENASELGGYKEVVIRASRGEGVYGRLRFESGGHRVQRVPATEAQGRIHTSACTVAVLPEPDEAEGDQLNPADLRIDTFRASAPAASTSTRPTARSASRTCPPGMVAECQDDRPSTATRPRRWRCCARLRIQEGSERAARKPPRARADRQRRPQRPHPHLQLPAGPADRPPHQPDAVPAAGDRGRRSRRGDRRMLQGGARRRAAGRAGRGGHEDVRRGRPGSSGLARSTRNRCSAMGWPRPRLADRARRCAACRRQAAGLGS